MDYKAARACPECGADSRVYNSRVFAQGEIVRFRECQVCGTRFMTAEKFVRFIERRRNNGD